MDVCVCFVFFFFLGQSGIVQLLIIKKKKKKKVLFNIETFAENGRCHGDLLTHYKKRSK